MVHTPWGRRVATGGVMNSITINDELLRMWRKDIAKLETEIKEKQSEIERLRRHVAAAAVLLPDLGDEDPVESHLAASLAKSTALPTSLPEAIRSVVGERWISRQDLRKELVERGFDAKKFGSSNTYFYNVIRRLLSNGELRRRGDKISTKQKAADQMD